MLGTVNIGPGNGLGPFLNLYGIFLARLLEQVSSQVSLDMLQES